MKKGPLFALTYMMIFFFIVAIILVVQIADTRKQTIRTLEENAKNLAQTLDKYSEGVLRQSEMLVDITSHIVGGEDLNPQKEHLIMNIIKEQKRYLEQLINLSIYNEKGVMVLSAPDEVGGISNYCNSDFFNYHKNNKSMNILIEPPFKNMIDGKWVMTVSRRMENINNDFNGVICLTLSIQNHLNIYGKVNIGDKGTISLLSSNGILFVRMPFTDSNIRTSYSNSKLLTEYLKKSDSGTSTVISKIDGVERIYAYNKNLRYGLITTVAFSLDDALYIWRTKSIHITEIVIFLAIGGVGIGFIIINDARKRILNSNKLILEKNILLSENAELEEKASLDGLTGISNRMAFDKYLKYAIKYSFTSKMPLSLIMIDVDHFKLFNDTYGHIEGDNCLKEISGVLINSLDGDYKNAYRYGGEEFAIILIDDINNTAKKIAKKIIGSIYLKNIENSKSDFGRVTVSVGVFSGRILDSNENCSNVIKKADDALYKAKHDGRNLIRIWERKLY